MDPVSNVLAVWAAMWAVLAAAVCFIAGFLNKDDDDTFAMVMFVGLWPFLLVAGVIFAPLWAMRRFGQWLASISDADTSSESDPLREAK